MHLNHEQRSRKLLYSEVSGCVGGATPYFIAKVVTELSGMGLDVGWVDDHRDRRARITILVNDSPSYNRDAPADHYGVDSIVDTFWDL